MAHNESMRWCKPQRTVTRAVYAGGRLLSGASGRFTRGFGKLPFVGRNVMREGIHAVHDARSHPARLSAYRKHLAYTAIMHGGHLAQGALATQTTNTYLSAFAETHHPLYLLGAGISGLYAAANGGSVLAQTDVAVRLGNDVRTRADGSGDDLPVPTRPPIEPLAARDKKATYLGMGTFVTAYTGSYFVP